MCCKKIKYKSLGANHCVIFIKLLIGQLFIIPAANRFSKIRVITLITKRINLLMSPFISDGGVFAKSLGVWI